MVTKMLGHFHRAGKGKKDASDNEALTLKHLTPSPLYSVT